MWEREKTDIYDTEPIMCGFYDSLDTLALTCLVAVHGWQYLAEKDPKIQFWQGNWRVIFWNDLMKFKIRLLDERKKLSEKEDKEDLEGWFKAIDNVNLCFIDHRNPEEKKMEDLKEESKKAIWMVLRHVKESIAARFDWLNIDLREVVKEVQTLGVIDAKTGEKIFGEVNIDVSSIISENFT